MALSKADWESYKIQHEATMKVHEMSGHTNQVIMEMIERELAKFPEEPKKTKEEDLKEKKRILGID